MAGIGDMAGGSLPSRMQAGQPAEPEGGDPAAARPVEGDDEESNVSPEEQAQYDQFMQNAMEIIYPKGEDAQVSPNIMKGLSATPKTPLLALASTAVSLVAGLRDSAKRAQSPISDEVLFHAGADLVAELAEIAEAAKIHEFSDDDVEKAFYLALDMYRSEAEQSGNIDKEAATQGWNEIVEADRNGTLAQQVPGIGERLQQEQG